MTPIRHAYLDANMDATLTEDEMKEGWRFCMCEWDGMLIQAGDEEAKYCRCFYNEDGSLKCE